MRTKARRRIGRLLALLALALAFSLTPGVAGAHAAFVSAEPEPGQELTNAPGVVVLRFTEPLNARLSKAVVTDPTGRELEGRASASGRQEIRIPLPTNALGVYTVDWTTVSTLDGHTLRGSFRFGVGVAPGEGAEGVTTFAPRGADLLLSVGRGLEYAFLLLAAGMLLLRRLGRRRPELSWVRPPLRLALSGALAGGIAVVLGEAFTAAGSASAGAVASYLTTGLPGAARLTRLIAEGAAMGLALTGGRLVIPSALAAMGALAAAGHAAAVRPTWWGIAVDAVHLVTAGLWVGGILALALTRPPGGWRGPEGRALLARFSPIAVSAFLATTATGILRGFQELSTLGDLVDTSYGQVLGLKVLGVLAMIPLSVLAWRRLARSVRPEAIVAVFVIGAAALLAAYPLPPGRVAEAEEAEAPAAESALPREGDLTLGGEAGTALIGLTLRPGEPGRNEALVYVLPLEGEEAASGVPVEISAGGTAVRMEECGPTCRRARLRLGGGERVEVRVGGPAGGTATFDLPELPAPDGGRLFDRLQARMHALDTFRIAEVFRPLEPPLRTSYALQAPDRMQIEASNGFQSVWVGSTRYRRTGPGEPWEVDRGGPPARVPSFIWDTRDDVVAPRIVGTETVEGLRTRILSFFAPSGSIPIWFRLWVTADDLVVRAEMRAQGHFMDLRYFDFDAPVRIQPPEA